MLIDSISYFECERKIDILSSKLTDTNAVNRLINVFKATLVAYRSWYIEKHPGKEYNDMIKEKISYTDMNSFLKGYKAIM